MYRMCNESLLCKVQWFLWENVDVWRYGEWRGTRNNTSHTELENGPTLTSTTVQCILVLEVQAYEMKILLVPSLNANSVFQFHNLTKKYFRTVSSMSPSLTWLLGDHNRFIVQKRPIPTAVPLLGNHLMQKAISLSVSNNVIDNTSIVTRLTKSIRNFIVPVQ